VKNSTDCGWLDDWAEGFGKINTRSLMKATYNPTGLVAVESAIGVELVTKYPLPGDDIGTTRSRNKSPSPIRLERIELVLHRSNQFRSRSADLAEEGRGDADDVDASRCSP
jgi:hypothetical protein